MRYYPPYRISHPNIHDARLWRTLDRLRLPYEKIAWIGDDESRKHDYYVAALVNNNLAIDWHDHNHDIRIRNRQDAKSALLSRKGIDYLLLKKKLSEIEIEITIRRYIRQMKG